MAATDHANLGGRLSLVKRSSVWALQYRIRINASELLMSRYHFNVQDGDAYPDKEGSEFSDLESVRAEAVRRSGELLQCHPSTFWNGEAWKMTVTDSVGLVLFTLNFAAVSSPATRHYALRPSEALHV